ncbi:MAG: M61 family peptidase [Bacteroidia bacterium]
MIYKISSLKPHTRFIEVETVIETHLLDTIILKLPNWRPGRYELGNFAKNIQSFKVVTPDVGNLVKFEKTDKSTWKIYCKDLEHIKVSYNYYSNQLDGGGCFTSEDQLYFNPVQCCMYIPEQMKTEHTIQLIIPQDWKIATGMRVDGQRLIAKDYDELADCPVIASPTLQHKQYESGGVSFHIWIQGDYQPDWNTLIKDFKSFSDLQIKVMQEFPAKDYHFLIQILPTEFYHGVEHLNSTVLALGPGDKLNERKNYIELLGVASHELYHSWNVKTIRPEAMMPYNYEKENYSRSGYIYEGFTTYFGDLFLKRCGVFTQEEFFTEVEKRINKHLNNYGRFNMSVADSSFDTWLDGYTAGVPNRKVSIYDEGSLIGMAIDLTALNFTKGKMRLETAMLALYQDFGKNNIGYRDNDARFTLEAIAGTSLTDVFENYVYKNASYFDLLVETLGYAGCTLEASDSEKTFETFYGFKIVATDTLTKIIAVAPDSPADVALLSVGDEIISAYGEPVKNNLSDLIQQHATDELTLEINSSFKKKHIVVKRTDKKFYPHYKIAVSAKMTKEQKFVFEKWLLG